MAIPLLDAIVFKRENLEHTAAHDLESFIWVLAYCVLRKLIHDAATDDMKFQANTFLKDSFGHLHVGKILKDRLGNQPFLFVMNTFGTSEEWIKYLKANVSGPLIGVLDVFRDKFNQIYSRNYISDPSLLVKPLSGATSLTHGYIVDVIEEAITSLEANPSI